MTEYIKNIILPQVLDPAIVKVALPIALLMLVTVLKAVIGKKINEVSFVFMIAKMPIDLVFLAISFVAAAIIAFPVESPTKLVYFIGAVFILAISIFTKRITLHCLDRGNWYAYVILLFNQAVGWLSLYLSVGLVRA